MKEKMRTIGYLCPRCRKPVMQQRSRFALAASGAIVQCECGKSELQIDFDGEKFRISVPCGVCGGEHLAECSADRSSTARASACLPETSELCCFIGEEYAVERALAQLQITAEKAVRAGRRARGLHRHGHHVRGAERIKGDRHAPARSPAPAAASLPYAGASRRRRPHLRGLRREAAHRRGDGRDLDRLCCRMTLQIPGKKG